jgi:hypothetical protein
MGRRVFITGCTTVNVLRSPILKGLVLKAGLFTAAVVAAMLGRPAGAAAQSPPAAQAQPAAEELLGFSRYLPEDIDGYISLMQMGRVVRTVGESKAWAQLTETPEIREALDQWRQLQESGKIPPEAQLALQLLQASTESEVTLAIRPDVSKNLLGVAKLFVVGFGGFAPSRLDPNSPEGATLAVKQAAMRAEFVATAGTIRIPTIALALRVRDHVKYAPFLQLAIEQGRKAMLEELKMKAPPEIFARLEESLAPVQVGGSSLWRFHLRLGDVFPEGELARGLERSPFDPAQQQALITAVSNLTIDVHLGFIGEYLTLVISADDDLVKQIVERHEGRGKNTLAASAAFAPIRAENSPATIGILYGDATVSRNEMRDSLLPMLRSFGEPQFMSLLGMPPESAMMITKIAAQLEKDVAAMPLKQHSVLKLDQGLKQATQFEYDREPVALSTVPLTTIGATPANSIGFVAWREGSFEPLWDQILGMIEQVDLQMAATQRQLGDNPAFAADFGKNREKLQGVMRPIVEKLKPSLHGEMAIVLGPFVEFAVEGEAGKEVPRVSIPSAALLVRSPSTDRAIEGFHELFQSIIAFAGPNPGRPGPEVPVTFDVKTVDGIEARVLAYTKAPLRGIEPHVTKLGEGLVISSSFELTKQIREAASGRAPTVTTVPAYQAVANELPNTADQLTYIDGGVLVKNIRSTVEQVFSFAEANSAKLRMSERDQREFAVVRRITDVALKFASTFRGAHSSRISEGRTDTLKEHVRFQDVTE